MVGAFRFFKQSDGRGHFADIEVDLEPAACATVSRVTFDVQDQTQYPAEWLAAAERGCRDALAALSATTPTAEAGFQVRITRLGFTWVDTAADAVYAASYLAVVTAAGERSRFELYRDTQWRVRACD